MAKLALILLTLWSSVVISKETKLCNDLYNFSCAPGDYDDGTGVGRNQNFAKNDAFKMVTEMNEDLFSTFKMQLGDPENAYLMKLALSTVKLNNSPYCKPKDGKYSEKCINDAALGLTDFAAREISGIYNPDMACPMCTAFGAKMQLSDALLLSSNSVYKDIKSSAFKKFRAKVKDDEQMNKIRDKVFPSIRSKIIAKIKSHVRDPETRQLLIDKMTDLKFESAGCGGDEQNQNLPMFLMANAAYNPVTNRFLVCNGLLFNNKSEFQMAFVVAHELSHAIDPCGVTVGPEAFRFEYKENSTLPEAEDQFPFEKIIGCLRDTRSAGAKRNSVDYSAMYGGGYGGYGDVDKGNKVGVPYSSDAGIPSNMEVSAPGNQFTGFCGKTDQITEAFSDWIAVEVLPEYVEENFDKLSPQQKEIGYSNVFRGLCQTQANAFKFDEHPSNETRINKILAVHPRVREHMGCKEPHPKYLHCVPGVEVTKQSGEKTLPPIYSPAKRKGIQ